MGYGQRDATRRLIGHGRWRGSARPRWQPSERVKAAEVQTKYIIVDMYAKAIQGMPAEQSVKATHDELVKIYAS